MTWEISGDPKNILKIPKAYFHFHTWNWCEHKRTNQSVSFSSVDLQLDLLVIIYLLMYRFHFGQYYISLSKNKFEFLWLFEVRLYVLTSEDYYRLPSNEGLWFLAMLLYRYCLTNREPWLSSRLSSIQTKTKTKTKLHGLSPRATAACRRSDCQLVRIEGATWSAWRIPTAVFLGFLDKSRYFSIK
jgi:hypothetical protein